MNTENEKTVRVRVAVVVAADGNWIAEGCRGWSDEDAISEVHPLLKRPACVHYLEATLPLPAASTLEAEVVGEVPRA